MSDDVVTNMRGLLDNLERWKPRVLGALEHANNTHTFDDVVRMILSNRIMFFSFDDCFTIMEVVEYPQFKVFHCFLAGGDIDGLMEVQEKMANVGQLLGCKYLSIAGRQGWLRALSRRGWKHVSTSMFVPIGEETDEWWRQGRQADDHGQAAERH